MLINVTRIEENINFIENKRSSIHTLCDDGSVLCVANLLAFADRIWLKEEFPLEIGLEFIYEIHANKGAILQGQIIEKGIDNYGHYIILLLNEAIILYDEKKPRPQIPYGPNEIEVILSPQMIKGSDILLEGFENKWPSFHETELTIIEKTPINITLKFNGGFLFDRIVEITLKDVICEQYDDTLEFFTKQELSEIKLRKTGEDFEFKLFYDYRASRLPEDFDKSILGDPNFDVRLLDEISITEEYKIHGVIKCKVIEMNVLLDEEKKRQLEQENEEWVISIRNSKQDPLELLRELEAGTEIVVRYNQRN